MKNLSVFWLAVVVFACGASQSQAWDDAEKITFEDHVKGVLRQRCAACHSPDKKSGGLDLTNYTALMQGGSSGASVEPGDADGSYLFMLVTHEEEPVMPPGGTKIPDPEIELLRKWIDGGALENKSSKSRAKKKTFDMAMTGEAITRPEIIPMPPHLPKEPAVHTTQVSTATAMAVSPWAPIAALAAPKQVLLYNTQTLEMVGVLDFPEGTVNVLRFSRNGQLLLAGGGQDGVSGKVVVWDITTGRRQIEVGDELDTVLAADISGDHRLIALGGPKKIVRVYSTEDNSLVYELKKHTDWITSIAFSPDSVLMASGDRAGGAVVWEAPTGNFYLDLRGHTAGITGLSWRADSNILASASEDTTVKLWEMENGGQVKSFNAHAGGTLAVSFSNDGLLATNGRDKVSKVFNQNGELQKQSPALTDIGTAVTWCNETKRVVAGDWTGKIAVWNPADGAVIGELSLNPLPLNQRVATAQSHLQQSQAELTPVAAELEQVTKSMNDLQGQIVQMNESKSALTTQITTSEQQLASAQQTMEAKVQEVATLQAELKTHQDLQPQLKDLSEKAATVAASSPNDAELKSTAETLANKLNTIDARISELGTRIAELSMQKASTEQEISAMTQKLAENKTQMESMATQITQMESQMEPLKVAVAEKTGIVQQLRQKVDAAQAMLTQWQGEVSFVDNLKAIDIKIQDAQKSLDDKAQVRLTIEQKLAELQSQLEAAKAAESSAQQGLDAATSERDQLQGIAQ
ncbi:MAG: c-type cytochrome domain-containing protein [Pirellulaceae bacterium]